MKKEGSLAATSKIWFACRQRKNCDHNQGNDKRAAENRLFLCSHSIKLIDYNEKM
jgi:hypothetical protein